MLYYLEVFENNKWINIEKSSYAFLYQDRLPSTREYLVYAEYPNCIIRRRTYSKWRKFFMNISVKYKHKIKKLSLDLGIAYPITFVFIVLKIGKVISWSWWWIFSPLLIALGIGIFIAFFILLKEIFKKH